MLVAAANELLQKALALHPQAIDPNFFDAECLLDSHQPAASRRAGASRRRRR